MKPQIIRDSAYQDAAAYFVSLVMAVMVGMALILVVMP